MKKSDFDNLLRRYLANQVTEKERAKIEAWLQVTKIDDSTGVELTPADEERLFQKITADIDESKDTPIFPVWRRTVIRPWTIGAAAAIALMAISFVLWNNSKGLDTDKLILNDGTLVWLKGGSNLMYTEKNNAHVRYAELHNGAALFEVAKDPARPFILKCGTFTIKVLGTSFNIRPVQDRLELEVLSGKVNISSSADTLGIDVTSNQKVIYAETGGLVRRELTEREISEATADTEYDMKFRNENLNKVFARIEKKFGVSIEADSKQLSNCRITADFTDHSLESTIMMISEVLPVEYKINGSTITLSGSGCK